MSDIVQNVTSFCAARQLAGVEFAGADAANFLQGQLTVHVANIPVGQFRRAAHCSRQGRILANGLLCRTEEERFVFVVAADVAEELTTQLRKFILRAKVRAELSPARFFAESSDGAAAAAVTEENGVTTIDGGGWRLRFADGDAAAKLAAHVDGDDDDWMRGEIDRAVPWIGEKTSGQFIPQFVNFEALNGVDFDKGCYVGQEIIARLHYRGEVKQRMMRVGGDGAPPPPMTPLTTAAGAPAGAIVNSAATPAGFVATAAVKTAAAGEPLLVDGVAVADIRPPPYPLPAGAK